MNNKIIIKYRYVANFKEILDKNYDAILFDAYGVLNDALSVFPFAIDTLIYLRERRIPYFLLSNDASKTPQSICDKFNEVSKNEMTLFSPENVILAGDPLINFLLRHNIPSGATVVYLGPTEAECFLRPSHYNIISINSLIENNTPIRANSDIPEDLNVLSKMDVFVLMDDQGFDWKKAFPNALLVCPNPDMTFVSADNEVLFGSGALTAMFESVLNKKFHVLGKPSLEFFNFAKSKVPNAKKILMVGDTIATDIAGAKSAGIDSCLVSTGNAKFSDIVDIIPTFACPSVAIKL